MDARRALLIRIFGPDQPGISADLYAELAQLDACVLDVAQYVVRHRLTLDVLVEVRDHDDLVGPIARFAQRNRVDAQVEAVDPDDTSIDPASSYVATILGPHLSPVELGAATAAIAEAEGNIDRIVRLSRYPVMSYELSISHGDVDAMRANLLRAATLHPGMDVAVQPSGLARRAKRLVVLDVDSTLIQDEVIELLADEAGCGAAVAAVTAAAMAGELDFEASLRARVHLLAGIDEAAIERAWKRLRFTPGARTFCRTLKRLGYTTGLVSGGFTIFTDRLQRELGIDHARANTLEIIDGVVTGQVVGPVVDRAGKAAFLTEIAAAEGIPLEQTVAVGDGANDLDMLATAGLGIAFNAKPIVAQAADTAIRVPYLDAILFLLGVRRDEIEGADQA